jgi:hypothetical protein
MDENHTTILDSGLGLFIVMGLNAAFVILALYYFRNFNWKSLLVHCGVLMFLLASPFIVCDLTIPPLALGEAAGPGDGIILLPVLGELLILLGIYVALIGLLFIFVCRKIFQILAQKTQGTS